MIVRVRLAEPRSHERKWDSAQPSLANTTRRLAEGVVRRKRLCVSFVSRIQRIQRMQRTGYIKIGYIGYDTDRQTMDTTDRQTRMDADRQRMTGAPQPTNCIEDLHPIIPNHGRPSTCLIDRLLREGNVWNPSEFNCRNM